MLAGKAKPYRTVLRRSRGGKSKAPSRPAHSKCGQDARAPSDGTVPHGRVSARCCTSHDLHFAMILERARPRHPLVLCNLCNLWIVELTPQGSMPSSAPQTALSVRRHRCLFRLGQRHRVGTRGKAKLSGRIIRSTPYHLSYV